MLYVLHGHNRSKVFQNALKIQSFAFLLFKCLLNRDPATDVVVTVVTVNCHLPSMMSRIKSTSVQGYTSPVTCMSFCFLTGRKKRQSKLMCI